MPTGATVQWSLSNTTDAYISGCPTCSTVSVCRNSTANTIVTLTATVSHCSFIYIETFDVSMGITAPGSISFSLIDFEFGKIQTMVDPVLGASEYNWYKTGVLNTTYHGTFAQIPISKTLCDLEYDIAVEAVNACGVSSKTHANAYVPCDSYYMVSPNAATSDVTVSTNLLTTQSANSTTVDEVRIYDFNGTLKKYQQFNKVKTAMINISGLNNGNYFIEIKSGTYKERHQLLIQK